MTSPEQKTLSKVTVTLGKSPRRGTRVRDGFKDASGQVFMPPKSSKRVSAWQKKMEDQGFLVG